MIGEYKIHRENAKEKDWVLKTWKRGARGRE